MIYFGLLAEVVITKTVFSYGELIEEIYIECPPGMKGVGTDNCIILGKCIHDLMQASRQYDIKAVKILKRVGFNKGNFGPWLYMKKSTKCVVDIALYVDDNLMTGNSQAKGEVVEQLNRNGLELKLVESLQDYLSHKIQF